MATASAVLIAATLAGALAGAPAVAGAASATSPKRHRSGQSAVPAWKDGPLNAADESTIARRWGVHIESMALASGGYMLELRYRIVDAARAQPLFSRKTRPLLKDDASGFESVVPSPPTTGALRSTYDAKAGRTYFMFFANPSRFVTAGRTVTVTIGDFVVRGIPVTDDSASVVAVAAPAPDEHEAHRAQMAAALMAPAARLLSPPPAIPDVALLDQDGQATTLRDALASDEPVLVNFIFTTCTTICPVMSAGLSQLLTNLGSNRSHVRVVSISIDPEADTPDTLRAYAARYHTPPSWRFLTGRPEAIEAAQRAFGNYRGGKNNHVAGTFVRSSAQAPWLALDGFSSAQTLKRAVMGELVPAPGS
jgi:cytochrome oxidase Cu insertion factor (SCO1/SenC/PrrC family)